MKILKRILLPALTVALLFGGAKAEVLSDTSYGEATEGAIVIDSSMVYETEADVTKEQIGALFNYTNGTDERSAPLNAGCNGDFTLYLGSDNAKNITGLRVYCDGSDSDEYNPPITLYGSNDATTWTELAKIEAPIADAWNEENFEPNGEYTYLRLESAMSVTDEDEVSGNDEFNDVFIEGETNTYHQRVSCVALFETVIDDEDSADLSSGGGYKTEQTVTDFSDIKGHWGEDVIRRYLASGYINGYPDGTFRPDDGVTVAEFCKIVSAIQGISYDVSSGSWSLPYIREMIGKGVIDRTDFDDYDVQMTREQVAKAAQALMTGEYYPKDLDQYLAYITDADDITPSYREYILKTFVSGVLGGYPDGTWKPLEKVTRAEILSVLDRVSNKDMREIPQIIGEGSSEDPLRSYYYTAAVQVRKNTNASGMQYRLYGSDAQYMDSDDDATGLKIGNEIQGAQGFAMVLRFDVSKIKENRADLNRLYLEAEWQSGGSDGHELGLWYYTYDADKTDWNNNLYFKNLNGSAVAGDDISGYNSVVSNIESQLPTWGNTSMAVPNSQKTKPVFSAVRNEENKYVFEITPQIDDFLAHADENNMVEVFMTSVNYDGYELDEDKPHIFTAGEKAPTLKGEYATGEN